MTSEKDSELAVKDKELALLSQKESQISEKVVELQKQLKDSKVEIENVLAQLNARSEDTSVSTSEQQAALDSLQNSYHEERETMLTDHATQLKTLEEDLASEQKKWEEESLEVKVEKAALQK